MTPDEVQAASSRYLQRIQRAALVLTGNPWDADDLAQETFLVLARRPDGFAGRSSLYTWLYGVLLNLERRRERQTALRGRKLRVLWDLETNGPQTAAAAEAPLEVAEWKQSLWSLVAGLPDGQRQALVLRYSQHLSYEEIAQVLECPLGTVKSRIFHALATLRRHKDRGTDELRTAPDQGWLDTTHAS